MPAIHGGNYPRQAMLLFVQLAVHAALALAALIAFFVQDKGPWVGLCQRMLVGTTTLWLFLVAFRIRPIVGTATPGPGRSTKSTPGRLGVVKRMHRDRTYATDDSRGSGGDHA